MQHFSSISPKLCQNTKIGQNTTIARKSKALEKLLATMFIHKQKLLFVQLIPVSVQISIKVTWNLLMQFPVNVIQLFCITNWKGFPQRNVHSKGRNVSSSTGNGKQIPTSFTSVII